MNPLFVIKMQKVAIIGGAGFIGSFLHKELSAKGFIVTAYDTIPSFPHIVQNRGRDIPVEELHKHDAVIYLGGLTGRPACNAVSEDKVIEENVEDVFEVGRKMLRNQCLIYASTATLLEGSLSTPVKEDWEIDPEKLDKYARSMYLREVKMKQLNVPTVGLRFGTVTGISPKQRYDLAVAMTRSAYLYNKIPMSHPKCRRAILWNRDLLKGVEAVLNGGIPSDHEVFHLASFNASVLEMAEKISEMTMIPIEQGEDAGDIGFSLDTSKIQERYGVTFEGTKDKLIRELIENIGHLCTSNISIEKECRVCKSKNTYAVLDMGFQPLANNYVNTPQHQDEYPLCLLRCKDCNHTQLNFTVKPEVMFRNYQYNSGTSRTLREYFARLVQKISTDMGKDVGVVLELACNDGSQLDEFKKLGWETWGVDPAVNIVDVGKKQGHNILTGFWGVDSFEFPTPDVIVAQNVLAHVPDPIRFLQACADAMNDDTYLYIQTSQCNMYRNGEFDTIYHEHLSFFTIASMMRATETCGLRITEVTKQPIHGTSYLFQIRKNTVAKDHSMQVISAYEEEKYIGMYTDAFYDGYQTQVQHVKSWVLNAIDMFVNKGIPIVGYGAAAKGMTLLNFFDIKNIEYIVDDATMKHGKYTPGKNIIITPPEKMGEDTRQEVCVMVLAWNFFDEISSKIQNLRSSSTTYMICPFPKQTIYVSDDQGVREYIM